MHSTYKLTRIFIKKEDGALYVEKEDGRKKEESQR